MYSKRVTLSELLGVLTRLTMLTPFPPTDPERTSKLRKLVIELSKCILEIKNNRILVKKEGWYEL